MTRVLRRLGDIGFTKDDIGYRFSNIGGLDVARAILAIQSSISYIPHIRAPTTWRYQLCESRCRVPIPDYRVQGSSYACRTELYKEGPILDYSTGSADLSMSGSRKPISATDIGKSVPDVADGKGDIAYRCRKGDISY